jgi:RNA polymerase sigma factor (sigma-70 family)
MFLVNSYSDDKLIAMIKSHSDTERNKALKYLYMDNGLRASVKKYVSMHNGDESDAEDVFQESLILLDNNVRNNHFEGRSTLKTYLISICKWKWFTMKRSRKRIVLTDDNLKMDSDNFDSPEVLMLSDERKSIVIHLLEKLEDKCRRILELYQLDYSMDEIAQQVGFTNVQSAKNAAARCRQNFRTLLEQNVELMTSLN